MNLHTTPTSSLSRRILVVLLALLLAAGVVSGQPAAVADDDDDDDDAAHDIVELAVAFDVLNVNRSPIACPTDGGQYEIGGYLVAPADGGLGLSGDDLAATVLLPGAVATERGAWRMKGFGGRYDVADGMARLGHIVVTINRLSFDTSSVPNGNLNCIGGEVDVIAQVLDHLRHGTYRIADGSTPPSFSRIALGGQSGGGMFATATAYSFPVVDALLVIASAVDQGMPADLTAAIATISATECGQGGLPKRDNAPTGYTNLIPLVDEFFGDIEPQVKAEFIDRAEREPCGLVTSLPQVLATNRALIPSIDVPVLLVAAEHDWAFPPETVQAQRELFTGSDDVTYAEVENAGHTLMIERGIVDGSSASERLRHELSTWLSVRGF